MTGGANLSVYSVAGMEGMAPGSMTGAGTGNFTLEFEVGDVDACYERLAARGSSIIKPPTTQPWGRRSVWLRDPDGNIANLYQPMPALPDPVDRVATYFQWCASTTRVDSSSGAPRTATFALLQRAEEADQRRGPPTGLRDQREHAADQQQRRRWRVLGQARHPPV